MSLNRLLAAWRTDPALAENVAAWETLPGHPAQHIPLPSELHPALRNALVSSSILNLYTHQAAAWELVQAGQHVAVVTGTASGKSLCYNLPVLHTLLSNPGARALYLFPTKALTQDQVSGLKKLSDLPAAIYDGDTPSSARPAIRATSRIVLTNPDMLHTGILPYHTKWAEFFQGLRYVVIDEMHTYRGVFGSHVANILRRLKRITRFYGANPHFILTSATIANPGEFGEKLIEAEISVVDGDGSERGPRHFIIYNPPVINQELGIRRSALQASVQFAQDLLQAGVQTIVFARSRRSVELFLVYLREQLPSSLQHIIDTQAIRGYRSGYLPAQRRTIEHGLRAGQVQIVVATNALELGIDIGAMGAALLVGYPGSIASTWQQAGRAGRGASASLAVLVTTADPLNQFLALHPEFIFDRSPECALINPDNLLILLSHLRCAAFELPFGVNEGFGRLGPERVSEFLQFLQAQGVLHRSGSRYFWMSDQYPAQSISLRNASTDNVLLQAAQGDHVTTIGEVDRSSAFWMVHPQAIYLHEGQSFQVTDLNLEQNTALLQPFSGDYYTEPRQETTVTLLEKLAEEPARGAVKSWGEINVTTQITGYRMVKWYTHEPLGLGDLSLPATELHTTGYWLSLPEKTVARLQEKGAWSNSPNDYGPAWRIQKELARMRDGYRCQVCGLPEQDRAHDVHHKIPFRTFPSPEQANALSNLVTLCPTCHRRAETVVRIRSGLAGLAYVLGHLAPFFLMCDQNDIGIHSDPQSTLSQGQPAVVLYDLVPAGIGFSQRLFEVHSELAAHAHQQVSACKCVDGCPACVGPGGEVGKGSKFETLAILEELI